jgi:hypothetical protein
MPFSTAVRWESTGPGGTIFVLYLTASSNECMLTGRIGLGTGLGSVTTVLSNSGGNDDAGVTTIISRSGGNESPGTGECFWD